ncbi:MAG: DMT family transporter [Woeseiaceae bacterium]|nr:DMT family transporter [Woeseiaceae bacterium]
MKTALLSALAMFAFAANSVFCRLALLDGHTDAASYATVRVIAGATVLALIVLVQTRGQPSFDADWRSALALYVYMVFFAFAYVTLATGTGALILFGAVQLTMFTVALRSGERFPPLAWFGLLLAIAGLLYLVSPGVTAPEPLGAVLMAIAGIAWGTYSLLGRKAADATRATAWNFVLSVPLVLATSLVFLDSADVSATGIALAILSGAIASGLGYVVWYAALKGLAASDAATIQLSVPVIAAIGGVVLLAEPVTMRLLVATIATLGGVAIVLRQRVA